MSDYNLPIMEDDDKADLNDYTDKLARALTALMDSGIFDGDKGDKGDDGVSPIVTVSKNGKVTTITITDINGTKTATINDGEDGGVPTDHASTATTYGVGTATKYGHCKTINNLTTSSHTNGNALSAYQGYLLNKKISDLKSIVVASNSGAHNSIYRGEDITDLFYDGTLSTQIANGTFDDIFIGDYIIGQNSGRKYLVADINYALRSGNPATTTPHVLMIPEKVMGTASMNDTDIVTGAYVGSKMYTDYLTPFRTTILNDFGTTHILSYVMRLANAVTNAYESGNTLVTRQIELMNEIMVYGSNIFHNIQHGTVISMDYTQDKSQLAIFRYRPDLIPGVDDTESLQGYWLRDVATATTFCFINRDGSTSAGKSTSVQGVRPAFLIY